MITISKRISNLSREEYYAWHLKILNTFLPVQLTSKEIEVLGLFMSFQGEQAEEERFGEFLRKKVKRQLGLSTSGLSNHIRSMVLKKAIVEDDLGVLQVHQFLLFPEDKEQFYQFKIEIKNESV